jgi:heme exporter protein D
MQWNSLAEFLDMGGRALFVWGSFGACLLVMLVEPILIRYRHKAVRDTLRRERIASELDRNHS